MTIEEFENLETDYAEEFDEGNSHLILDDIALVSNEYDLTIRTGVWCEKNDEGEWEPDWAFTLLHRTSESPEQYLYLEQDGIEITLRNYANANGMNFEKLREAFDLAA
jgi:hypothetical protein